MILLISRFASRTQRCRLEPVRVAYLYWKGAEWEQLIGFIYLPRTLVNDLPVEPRDKYIHVEQGGATHHKQPAIRLLTLRGNEKNRVRRSGNNEMQESHVFRNENGVAQTYWLLCHLGTPSKHAKNPQAVSRFIRGLYFTLVSMSIKVCQLYFGKSEV